MVISTFRPWLALGILLSVPLPADELPPQEQSNGSVSAESLTPAVDEVLNTAAADVAPEAAAQQSAVTPNAAALEMELEESVNAAIDAAIEKASAAAGKALTPAEKSAGFAAIWDGEKRFAYCECEKMQLGEKASRLFSTVSQTFFNESNTLARSAKQPEQTVSSSQEKKPKASAKKMQPVLSNMMSAKVQVEAAPEDDIVVPAPKKAAAPRPKKMTVAEIAAANPAPKPELNTGRRELVPMPKVQSPQQAVITQPAAPSIEEPAVSEARPWPEQGFASVTAGEGDDASMPSANAAANAKSAAMASRPAISSGEDSPMPQAADDFKAYSAPEENQNIAANVAPSSAPDCDTSGSKMSRGRLAWMECYYRIAGAD